MVRWVALLFYVRLLFATYPEVYLPGTVPSVSIASPNFEASFIYWQFSSDFVYANQGATNSIEGGGFKQIIPEEREYAIVDWHFHPGFKAGVGLNFEHDAWDILATYTWLFTNDSNSKPFLNDQGVKTAERVGGWFVKRTSGSLLSGKMDFALHTHQLDIELGRGSSVSEWLSLRPFFGLKGFILRHKVLQKYRHFNDSANRREKFFVRQVMYSPGFGVRGGIESKWEFGKGISLFGKGALTGGWVFHDGSAFERLTDNMVPQTSIVNLREEYHEDYMGRIAELALGVRWERDLGDNDGRISMDISLEQQSWTGRFMAVVKNVGPDLPNFSLKGVTLRGRFDF